MESNIKKEHDELADKLQGCLYSLQQFIAALRGEMVDQTGVGLERIFKSVLEHALNVKIITQDQWDYFVKLDEDSRKAKLGE